MGGPPLIGAARVGAIGRRGPLVHSRPSQGLIDRTIHRHHDASGRRAAGPQPPSHSPEARHSVTKRARHSNLQLKSVTPEARRDASSDHHDGAQFQSRPPSKCRPRIAHMPHPPHQFDLTDVPLEDTLSSSHNVFFYQAHEQLPESK